MADTIIPGDRPDPAAEPSQLFGRYRLVRCLGQGGMGAVWLAQDEHLQRPVALKQILGRWRDHEEAKTRFRREALALSRLDHPCLCRIFDAGEHEGTPFVSMQYVPGQTLEAAINAAAEGRQPLLGEALPAGSAHTGELQPDQPTIDRILALFAKAADALHHAHTHGLVHRDVKPANLMIAENGDPIVLDFGLALDRDAGWSKLTASGQGVGTPLYMPPEQVRGLPADARSDVYALAVALYHVLTLTPPFVGLTHQQLFERILHERAPDPRRRNPAVPRDLVTVLAVALAKDPDDRYRDAAAFAADLQRVRARQPILARPQSRGRRVWRWCQRNPVVATLFVVISVSLIGTAMALVAASRARAGMRVSLRSFDRLATIEDLRTAEALARELWPAWPETIPALLAWQRDHGDPIAAQLPTIRDELAQPVMTTTDRVRGHRGDRDEVDPSTQAYVLRTLHEQLPALELFVDGEQGTRRDVARRLLWARAVGASSLQHPAWPATSSSIAANPRYRNLSLAPQADLVPLGPDPRSQLHEFLHLPSHPPDEAAPARDTNGDLLLTESSGIVFVLLPGGAFTVGAERDPAGDNHDPEAELDEPVQRGELAPFFLAKHEMTQAQWQRLTGRNPSGFPPTVNAPWKVRTPDGREEHYRFTLRHPVEQVDWFAADELLRQQGLVLPSEVQWEYACRAGTATPFSCPADALRAYANLCDASAKQVSAQGFGAYHDWSDGQVVTAPVGAFTANAFGLHDMHGNVYEWCRDWYRKDEVPVPGSGDGLRDGPDPAARRGKVARGGDYRVQATFARSADRMHYPPTTAANTIGVRPARRVLPASQDSAGEPR